MIENIIAILFVVSILHLFISMMLPTKDHIKKHVQNEIDDNIERFNEEMKKD